jgi:hypothetical protein
MRFILCTPIIYEWFQGLLDNTEEFEDFNINQIIPMYQLFLVPTTIKFLENLLKNLILRK